MCHILDSELNILYFSYAFLLQVLSRAVSLLYVYSVIKHGCRRLWRFPFLQCTSAQKKQSHCTVWKGIFAAGWGNMVTKWITNTYLWLFKMVARSNVGDSFLQKKTKKTKPWCKLKIHINKNIKTNHIYTLVINWVCSKKKVTTYSDKNFTQCSLENYCPSTSNLPLSWQKKI